MVDSSRQQARTSKQATSELYHIKQICAITKEGRHEIRPLLLPLSTCQPKSDPSRLPSEPSVVNTSIRSAKNSHTAFLGSFRALYDFNSRRTFIVAVAQLASRAPYGPLLLGLFAQLHNPRVRLFQLVLGLIFPSRLLGRLDDILPLHLSKEAQQLTHHIVRLPDQNHPFNLLHYDNNARPLAHPRITKKESISQRRKGSQAQPNLEQEST